MKKQITLHTSSFATEKQATLCSGNNSTFNRFLIVPIFLMALLWSNLGFGQSTYNLVTSASGLVAGEKYLIVGINSTNYYAAGTQATANRTARSITVASNATSVTPAALTSDLTPFEYTLGGSSGAWTLYDAVNGGYLYASSSSANQLKTQATNDANGQWAITIGASPYVASTIAQGSNTRKYMQFNYNAGSPLFACYASASMTAVYFYKKAVSCAAPTITLTSPLLVSVCKGTTSASLAYSATLNSPDKYSIDWDATANTAGFTDFSLAALPSSPISLTIPAAPAVGTYNGSLTVTNSSTSCTSSSYSISVTVVSSATAIAPTADQNLVASANGTLLTVTEGSTPISRVWKYGTALGGPYGTSTGVTTTTYTPNFAAAGTYYVACLSTYPAPCSATVTSNEVKIIVTANGIATSAISGSPFCAGASASVTYTITGTYTAGNVFTAQLSNASGSFASPTSIGTLTSTVAGTILATIPAGATTGTGYRIRVISSTPAITGSDNGTNLTINAIVTPSVSIAASATTICAGTSVTFTPTPTNGGTPTYQWKLNGSNIATGSTYTTTSLVNGDKVTCVMTSNATCPSPTTATSNEISMTVNALPSNPAGTITPVANPACGSTTISYSAPSASIYWQGTNSAGSSTTQNTTTAYTVSASGTYYVRAYSGSCWSASSASSAAITINTAPSISVNPSAQSVSIGATATFSVTASGTNLTYQWQINTGSWADISGATSSSYTTAATTLAMDGYQYRCVVSSTGCASATSTAALLTVTDGPCLPNESFESASVPANWTQNSVSFTTTGAHTGTYKAALGAANDWLQTPQLPNPKTLTFWAATTSVNAIFTVRVQTSTDGISYSDAMTYSVTGGAPISTSYNQYTINLDLTGNYYIRWNITAWTQNGLIIDDVIVTCSATVIKGEPTNDITGIDCSPASTTDMSLDWTNAIGAVIPDGYLVKWSKTAMPVDDNSGVYDGNYIADSPGSTSGSLNIPKTATKPIVISGLSVNTQYYFKVWSYTNSGTDVNYKTLSAPSTSCTTFDVPCASNGFETGSINGGSEVPTNGWSIPGNLASVSSNAANAHTGTGRAQLNSDGDIVKVIMTSADPASIKFWTKAAGATDNYTIAIQKSDPGLNNWTTVASISANGSNTGAITNVYTQQNLGLYLTGTYELRFIMTPFSSGTMYLDDVEIFCNSSTPKVTITRLAPAAGNVEQNADNHLIYSASILSEVSYATLSSLSFTTAGNYGGNYDLKEKNPSFKLWYNTSNTITGATLLSSQNSDYSGDGETIIFSSLNTSVAKDATGYFFITANIGCNATIGNTININALANANFTFSSLVTFNTAGPYAAGGLQTFIAATTVANVTSANATDENTGTSTITCTAPNCYDDIIIVASTSPITYTPSGDGSAYTSGESLTYGAGTALASGQYLIYEGTTSSQILTNLIAGTYYIKIFTRKGSVWSTGVPTTAVVTAKAEPTNQPTNFTCGASTSSSITPSWTAAITGTVAPDKYLLMWSTDQSKITAATVSDGAFVSDGVTNGVTAVSITHPTSTYSLTGLPTNTTVYFKIWSYTNSGTSVDYKIDSPLSGSCATQPDACLSESFESSFPPVDWTDGGTFQKTTSGCAGSKKIGFNAQGDYIITPVLNSPSTLTFQYNRSSNTEAWTLKVQSSTSTSGPWTDIQSISNATETCQTANVTLGLSGAYYLRFLDARASSLSSVERYIDDINVYCVTTICAAPTIQASSFTIPNGTVTSTTMDLGWTSGNGTSRIVVIKAGSAVDFVPGNGHNYTANSDYSAAADLTPTGNRVVYNGSGTSVSVIGLTGGTTYYYKIFEYNCANGSQAYYTSGTPASANNTTKPAPVTDLAVSCLVSGSATITWTAPEGSYDGVIIGVRQGSACEAISGDASSYAANTAFNLGGLIGTATRTVYNTYSGSTGTSVTVSNLTTAPYYIMAYTYKGSASSVWSATPQPAISLATSGAAPVTSVQAAPMNASAQIIWTNPASGCFTQVMVVANPTSATAGTPSGSSYIADPVFTGAGTVFNGTGKVVYLGTGNSVIVTGLTNTTQYCFTVFVWNGSAWSTGVYDCTIPIAGATVFVPGDVAVLAVNSNIASCSGGSSGDDELSIVFFKPITTGTTIDMTDNGWDRCNHTPEDWGNAEGYMRIRYTGATTIPIGTIITFRFLNASPFFQVLYPAPASGYTWAIDLMENSLVFNTNGDQIYFMQGGTWNQGTTGGNNATYTGGTFLFAFNTNDDWTSHICSADNVSAGTGRSQNSGLVFGMECFNMAPRAATDYLKYVGPLTPATQRDWITLLKDPDNWTPYSGCAAYNAGLPNYLTTNSISIITGSGAQCFTPGTWTGAANEDWFECQNWGNLRVPDKTVNVELPSNANITVGNNCKIGAPPTGYTEASCLNFTNNLAAKIFDLTVAGSKLDIWGNYSNNSAYTQTAGLVTFKGATAQTLSGTSVPTFHNLTLNNGLTNGLTLSTNINVKGTITLSSGKLTTQDLYTIDLGSAGSIVESTPTNLAPTSYVIGHVKATRNIGGGTNQTFGGIGLEIDEPSASNSTVVTRTTGTSILVSSTGASILRYFDITPTTDAGLNAKMIFHYFDYEIAAYLPEIDLEMWKSMPSGYAPWYVQAATITESTNISTKTGISSFSRWTLAPKNKPLPIELLQFEAVCNENKIDMAWSTASETNNDYFTIEKSFDTKTWDIVTTVMGSGNTNTIANYSYTDNDNKGGSMYYRLKQTDFDGEYTYFEPVAVKCDDIFKSINLYPNPASGQTICSVYSKEQESARIEITNYMGTVVFSENFDLQDGFNTLTIDVSEYQSGFYYVVVRSSDGTILGYKQLVINK